MDATRLRNGLTEYVTALDRQLFEIREQRERLDVAWRRTRDVYQGSGAEVFGEAFDRSMRMLQSYVEMLELVVPILKIRIEALEHFNSAANPEP